MGSKISIDKHVSNLDDILGLLDYMQKVTFESKIPDSITQHLKIWKFQEDKRSFDQVKSSAVQLGNLNENGFRFSSQEAYLLLLIYKAGSESQCDLVQFPHSLWGVVESAQNLTPRGLATSIAQDEDVQSLDSFLLSNRRQERSTEEQKSSKDGSQFHYMIFAWNGKGASAMVKAQALSRGYELDSFLMKGKDSVLRILFSGGVIRGKKLQRGSVYLFDDVMEDKTEEKEDNPNEPSPEQLLQAYETVYLLQWLIPESTIQKEIKSPIQKNNYKKFGEIFGADKQRSPSPPNNQDSYWMKFDNVDNIFGQVPSLLGKLPHEKVEPKPTQIKKPVIPSLGLGGMKTEPAAQKPSFSLNLDGVNKQDGQSNGQDATVEIKKPNLPGLALGGAPKIPSLNIGAAQEEKSKVPGLKLGNIQNENSQVPMDKAPSKPVPGLSLGGGPKAIPGLDLTKPKEYQQEYLKQTEGMIKQAQQIANEKESNRSSGTGLSISINNVGSLRECDPAPMARRDSDEEIKGNNFSDDIDSFELTKEKRPEQLPEEFFDIKGTDRTAYTNEFYKKECSEILPDFLYLGSDFTAQREEIMIKHGITHVVNCSADYSSNYHTKLIEYKKYHLKDHNRENIECIFYDVIDFIESCKKANGKVYVHCVQGVSRSSTVCISYLIYTRGLTFDEAFSFVREKRGIVNPNAGFIAQLMNFHKRLHGPSYDSITTSPRVFVVASHQAENPDRIVARMLMENLFHGKPCKSLDPRAIIILHARNQLIVWYGSQILASNYQHYAEYTEYYLGVLQKNEKAPERVIRYKEGEEDSQFWQLFGLDKTPNNAYERVAEWNIWFQDIEAAKQKAQKISLVQESKEDKEQIKQENMFKPKFYEFPRHHTPMGFFEYDDLSSETYLIVCVRGRSEDDEDTAFIYHGANFDPQNVSTEEKDAKSIVEFKKQVLDHFWGKDGTEDVLILEEDPQNPSDEFMDYFE